jgi:hypothetical protein
MRDFQDFLERAMCSRRPFPEPGVIPAAARVEIGESTVHGLGIFAVAPIRRGEVFEACVGLPLFQDELSGLICDFVYEGNPDVVCMVVLGYGSIINHDSSPNVKWVASPLASPYAIGVVHLYALYDIEAGEELFHNYNWPSHAVELKADAVYDGLS